MVDIGDLKSPDVTVVWVRVPPPAPMEDPIPQGLTHYHQWPEYNMAAEFPADVQPVNIGSSPIGVRWNNWPFDTELYISDEEPKLQSYKKWRLLQWQRISHTEKPKGWWQPSKESYKREAFVELTSAPYWEKWSASTRQYRNRWRDKLLGSMYSITSCEFSEFKQAYEESLVAKRIGMEEFDILERKWHDPATRPFLSLAVVRELQSGTIAAGMALLHSPTCKSEYYQTGFVRPAFAKEHLMVGLMDYWFQHARARGTRFLALGHLWKKGNDVGKKGYSDFKLQFAPIKILFPPMLVRLVPPR